MTDYNDAADALWTLDPNCSRGEWVKIAHAAQDAGLDLRDFDAWSQGAGKYRKGDTQAMWRSLKPGSGERDVTAETLFWLARQAGWTPGKAPQVPARPKQKVPATTGETRSYLTSEQVRGYWNLCREATCEHPYIQRKGGRPDGLRVWQGYKLVRQHNVNGWLVVPVYQGDQMISLQFISPEPGIDKLNLYRGSMKGYHAVGEVQPGTDVFIAEGIGHCWSINAVTQAPAMVAFGAGNIERTVRAALELGANPIIVPDRGKEQEAERIASKTGVRWCRLDVVPGDDNDINDIHLAQGQEAVRAVLATASHVGTEVTPEADAATPFDEAMAAIESDDPGAAFEPRILELLTTIRWQSPSAWQRLRSAAKTAKLQVGELDRLTQPPGEGGEDDLFPAVEPWPEPVDGAALVRELSDTLRRYVVCEPYVADAAALWIVFTWFVDQVHVAPIANITAPLPNCGKSVLLDFIGEFCSRPLKCDGISSAALFRGMDEWRPTLLIDETDTFLKECEDARGVLNSGHKRNGFIIRVEGDGADRKPVRFRTWGAKVLCGIGAIADTLASRSIRLELRRKLPTEKVENLRFMPPELHERLSRQLARLHEDRAEEVAEARPDPVRGLDNRAADNWEPLQQIAAVIGGEWPERVQSVAITIARNDDEELSPDINVELLKDVKSVFEDKRVNSIFSSALIESLCADEDAPWCTWNKGKPMRQRQLTSRLKEFGITARDVRIGKKVKSGFHRNAFQDVFARYLSPAPPSGNATSLQSSNHAGCSDFGNATQGGDVAFENARETSSHAGCSDVAFGTPPSPGEKEQF